MAEIYSAGPVLYPSAFDSGRRGGAGKVLVLQLYLSLRHLSGRYPLGSCQRKSTIRSGLALELETIPAAGHFGSVSAILQAVLSLFVSAGRCVRLRQFHFFTAIQAKRGGLYHLWQLQNRLSL